MGLTKEKTSKVWGANFPDHICCQKLAEETKVVQMMLELIEGLLGWSPTEERNHGEDMHRRADLFESFEV